MAKNNIDITGRAAKGWHEEIAKATKKSRDYNSIRRDRTEKLRRALTEVWAALEAGQTVNGLQKKEEWARWYNETARTKNPIRQIQKIVAGPKEPKPKANTVRLGHVISIGDVKFKIKSMPDSLHDMQRTKGTADTYRCNLLVEMVVEEKVQAPEKKTRAAQTQTRSQKQTTQAIKNMEAAKKNKKDRTPKTHAASNDPGKTYCRRNWTLSMLAKQGEEPTCVKCAEKLNSAKRAAEIKSVGPTKYMEQKKKDRERKSHRLRPDSKQAWCGAKPGFGKKHSLLIASPDSEPTCQACVQHEYMEEMRCKTATVQVTNTETVPDKITLVVTTNEPVEEVL